MPKVEDICVVKTLISEEKYALLKSYVSVHEIEELVI